MTFCSQSRHATAALYFVTIMLIIRKFKHLSQRHILQIVDKSLSKSAKIKSKILGLKNQAGRCNAGSITSRHRGGGHKKRYRIIKFKRHKACEGVVFNIEYDPNRNANIAAVFDKKAQSFFYIIAPSKLNTGDIVKSGINLEPKIGYSMPLTDIPSGSFIYNISNRQKNSAVFTRAAGTQSVLVEKLNNNLVKLKLNSGKVVQISSKCYASIGTVSNEFKILNKKYKAGNSRWLNTRPTVRGVAMNPVDHPHGGGEGKKSGKRKTPWGKTTKSKN